MTINPYKVVEDRLITSFGLDKYSFIMSRFHEVDVSEDENFQRVFNGFYGVRRNLEWRQKYYAFFESNKEKQISYADIILWLYDQTGNIEASFSSKMLATLDPNRPIWDQYVLKNLNLQISGYTKREKLEDAIRIYNSIENWYIEFLQTNNAEECITAFDKVLPSYTWLTKIKKIDLFLWSIR